MSPEVFTGYVRRYCEWAESNKHDMETVHQLLLVLLEGAPGLTTLGVKERERGFPGIRDEPPWSEYKRYADFPFQCYPQVFWPREVDPKGPFTENIYEDFAHIYTELRHGLQVFDRGDSSSAFTYWRDSYFCHWGHHASAAVWGIEWYQPGIKSGEQAAAPNGGPAMPPANSKAAEGPPSVS